jgi:hypothetical protein
MRTVGAVAMGVVLMGSKLFGSPKPREVVGFKTQRR